MAVVKLNDLILNESLKTYGEDDRYSDWNGVMRDPNQSRGGYFCQHGTLRKLKQIYKCPMRIRNPKKGCKAFIWFEHESVVRPRVPKALRPRRWLQRKHSRQLTLFDKGFFRTGRNQRLHEEEDDKRNKSDGIGGHLAGKGIHQAARDGSPAAGSSSSQIESASSRDEQSKDSSHNFRRL